MKKIWKLSAIAGLSLVLGACGNSGNSGNSDSNNDSTSQSESSLAVSNEETKETESTQSAQTVNEENLNSVASMLEEKFNTDGEKMIAVEIQNDVADDTSDTPHSVIEARVVDDEARKNVQEMKEAIDSNDATDEQLTAIYGIQLNVEEVAKQLESDTDIIKFINPDTNNNNIVIALANKNENIIPLVK